MSSPDWRLQPLLNFWQNVNWENRAISPASVSKNGSTPLLSLLMPVREYFRAVSWTGIPEIASTVTEIKPNNSFIVDEGNETLEDFLDDISKFF